MEENNSSLRRHFKNRDFLFSVTSSFCFFAASLVMNYFMNEYTSNVASSPVTDIILDNIPVYDVDGIYVYGPIFLFVYVLYLCIKKPQIIPFLFKSTALFIFIRSIFMSLTHIGMPVNYIAIDPSSYFHYISFGPDLFFSGVETTFHPFLMPIEAGQFSIEERIDLHLILS